MANRFVRKGGNDANTGLSNALAGGGGATGAWLTIGKALGASGMADGDVLYVGAGTYREVVTIGFTPTGTTSIIADVDGSQTGDPGPVVWSAYTTNDSTAPANTAALTLNGKNFLSFSKFYFMGGAPNPSVVNATTTGSHDITFTDCTFVPGVATTAGNCISQVGTAAAQDHWLLDRCRFLWFNQSRCLSFANATSASGNGVATGDWDRDVVIRNCLFVSTHPSQAIYWTSSGANTFKQGGLKVYDCTFVGGSVGTAVIYADTGASINVPVVVSNCHFYGVNVAIGADANGKVVEDYNLIQATTPRSNVAIGPFSNANMLAVYPSLGYDWTIGANPRPPFSPWAATAPSLGFKNAIPVVGQQATVTDDATVGTIAWTTPANASVPDGTSTTDALTLNATGHYLNAQSFTGFAGIPANATIKSIRVELIALASVGAVVLANSVKLLKAGAIVGNDLASSNATKLTTSAVIMSWGSAADPLWGTTWTVAQVQAAGFGCVWSPVTTTASTVSVDFIRIIVAYTTVDGAGGVAVDMLGNPRPAGGNSTAYAVGALERGNTAALQTTTSHTGSNPTPKITGPGYQDYYQNVDATSVVIGVWARYDTTAQQPTVTIKAAPALGLNADTVLTWADPGTNAWAQFTATIVPTAAGIIKIRCQTANGTGAAYFADETPT